MMTTHDDLPHPVPPYAYLRYKENWFFIIIDPTNRVYGMAHFNYEPGYERARISCNLMVQGELYKYGNEIPFPSQFALSPEIGDDNLKVRFVKAHEQIDLRLHAGNLVLDMTFLKHAPTFDYEAYDAANPDQPSAQEIVNFATNQIYRHQQQAMTISGSLTMKTGALNGKTIKLTGMGYRDHSRGMRCDNMSLKHVWSFLYFPNTVIGAMSLSGVLRPTVVSNSGYVHDQAGLRSLKAMEITAQGEGPDGMPATVHFALTDVYGKPFTVIADIANRLGHVPLVVEKAGGSGFVYNIVENFCTITLKETGESGYALVEIGYNAKRQQ